ncbi:acylaminoacyl-peptidase, partial [Phenoliferia sp. Uapishka_3]
MTQIPEVPLSPLTASREQERLATHKARVDSALDAFNELIEVPVITSASFIPPPTSDGISLLHLTTSQRSVQQLNKRSGSQTLTLSSANIVLATSPIAFTSADVVHSSASPDGRRTAVFRINAGKEGNKKLSIEVWDAEGAREMVIEVGDRHRDFYMDATFGPPNWNATGTAIVYTAEGNQPKSSDVKPDGEAFKYTPDLGETFTGKKDPCVFLLFLPTANSDATLHQLTTASTTPGVAFGQAIFLPSESATPRILVTGYKSLGDARRLGLVYCTNRSSAIYELELEQVAGFWKAKSAVRQSEEGRSARSPRLFLPPPGVKNSPLVVFLSNPEGGVHGGCAQLHAVRLSTGDTAVLVAQVDAPATLADFPGLYIEQLPPKPFTVVNGIPHVICSSLWRSRKVPLAISLRDGSVRSLSPWVAPSQDPVLPYLGNDRKLALSSTNVIGTDGSSRIIGLRSGPLAPPELVLMDLKAKSPTWTILRKPKLPKALEEASASLDYTIFPLPKFEPTEVILISPCSIDPSAESSINLPPLITIPHGGPHSGYSTEFSAQYLAYVLAGYRVALVNYPGSLGYGQTSVVSLPPQLGTLDVEASLATPHFLNTISLASRQKGSRLYVGGSHGGFIGTHLSGQYPEEFDAFLLRNPVTDLGSMIFATDIPDWTYEESDLEYSLTKPPATLSPKTYEKLHALSPMTHVEKVTAPTMLLVGEGDRRVPPDQSRNYYHALKKNGTPVEMYTFPGNGHALDSTVETEVVGFALGLRFLERHTVF